MPEVVPVPVIYPRSEQISGEHDISITLNGADPSDTAFDVWFTINGDKPVVPTSGSTNKHTLKYTKPFRLSAGRRHTVKAITQPRSKYAEPSPVATKFYQVVAVGEDVDLPFATARSTSATQRGHAEDVRNRLFDADAGPGTSRRGRTAAAGSPRRGKRRDHGGDVSPGSPASNTSDVDMAADEEEFLEERRWDQLAEDAAVCDLCQVPWPDDSTLYCVVCGYRKPESITAIAQAKSIARSLEHVSPAKPSHSHTSEPPAGPAHAGLLSLLDDLGGGGGGGAGGGPGSPSARRRAEVSSLPRRAAVDEHQRKAAFAERRVAAAEAASAGPTCPGCSCAVNSSDRVCMRCGTQLGRGSVLATDVQPHSVGSSQNGAAAAGMVRCTQCSKFSPAGATTCVTCDAPVQASVGGGGGGGGGGRGGVARGVVAHPLDLAHMMVCMSCSKTNPKNARFCNWCGFKAPLPVQQVQLCPSCRTENLLSDRFCSDCGGHMPAADSLDGRDAVGGGDHSIMRLYDELEDGSVAPVSAVDQRNGGAVNGSSDSKGTTLSSHSAYAALSEHDRQILAEARGRKKKMRSTAVQTGL